MCRIQELAQQMEAMKNPNTSDVCACGRESMRVCLANPRAGAAGGCAEQPEYF